MREDDDLETIELELDPSADAAPRHAPAPFPRGRVVAAATALTTVAVVVALAAHARESSRATPAPAPVTDTTDRSLFAPAPTTWTVPAGVDRLLPGGYVAVVDGVPMVAGDGPTRRLLGDGPAIAVGFAAHGSVLVSTGHGGRVVVGPPFDGTGVELPGPVELVPDARGRWWTDWGWPGGHGLRKLSFPPGRRPAARLADGTYLLVDDDHTALLRWRPPAEPLPLRFGDIRVLAIAGDRLAWSDDAGATVYVMSLSTGHTTEVRTGAFALTARFSVDGSHLAVLVSGADDDVVLADVRSGRVVWRATVARNARSVPAPDYLPPAYLPVPFTWLPDGHLAVVVHSTEGLVGIVRVDAGDGVTSTPARAPPGLDEVVALGR